MKNNLAIIPSSHYDLFDGPVYCVLTTINKHGFPESSVVWSLRVRNQISVNTIKVRQKYENVINNPRVSILALDEKNHNRWINVRGEVTVRPDDNYDHINSLTKIYAGFDTFYGNIRPIEQASKVERVILTITPRRVYVYPRDLKH